MLIFTYMLQLSRERKKENWGIMCVMKSTGIMSEVENSTLSWVRFTQPLILSGTTKRRIKLAWESKHWEFYIRLIIWPWHILYSTSRHRGRGGWKGRDGHCQHRSFMECKATEFSLDVCYSTQAQKIAKFAYLIDLARLSPKV